jgi:hypothetical protein
MANLYTIQDLLIGKSYNSKTLRGEIISADKSDIWYENAESYLVQIKSDTGKYTYRTISVKVGE